MNFEEIFNRAAVNFDPEKFKELKGKYGFEISGGIPEKFTIEVTDDRVIFINGINDALNLKVISDMETIQGIISGDIKAVPAFMSGKVKILGDMTAAMKIKKLFNTLR